MKTKKPPPALSVNIIISKSVLRSLLSDFELAVRFEERVTNNQTEHAVRMAKQTLYETLGLREVMYDRTE